MNGRFEKYFPYEYVLFEVHMKNLEVNEKPEDIQQMFVFIKNKICFMFILKLDSQKSVKMFITTRDALIGKRRGTTHR